MSPSIKFNTTLLFVIPPDNHILLRWRPTIFEYVQNVQIQVRSMSFTFLLLTYFLSLHYSIKLTIIKSFNCNFIYTLTDMTKRWLLIQNSSVTIKYKHFFVLLFTEIAQELSRRYHQHYGHEREELLRY